MTESQGFRSRESLTLAEIVALTRAEPLGERDLERQITGVAPLDLAGPTDIAFYDDPGFLDDLQRTAAGACFMKKSQAAKAPHGVAVLASARPYLALVAVARELYAGALKPATVFGRRGVDSAAFVHPEAQLEDDVAVDPGAVIGPRAEIGSGSVIGANAVIGADVCIGRDCSIGPGSTVLHALIGDRVVLHPGVRIGQDGFGYVPGQRGMLKIPQVGRVIIQDDVEIGAGSAVDRGASRDTLIGEGTKIDNLVQIGHNVTIGRHCAIVAQVGLAGSVIVGDGVQIGGQVGVADHVMIGDGARIGAQTGVYKDVVANASVLLTPARPVREAAMLLQEWDDAVARRKQEVGDDVRAESEGNNDEQTG